MNMSNNLHMVVSASLRSRPIWDVLLPIFKSNNTEVALEDTSDDTYDIAFYFPCENSTMTTEFRILLITPDGVEEANRNATLIRSEEFSAAYRNDIETCQHAIVFLNSNTAFQTASGRCTVGAFISLQILLFESPSLTALPFIMVAEPIELLTSLKEHCHTLQRSINNPPGLQQPSSPLSLLEQIVLHASDQFSYRHNLNILSDLFPSLQALSIAIKTPDGRQLIADYLGDRFARNIVAFWNDKWICG